ncbi:myelin-associated glycoprotein-like isoform X2 [Solea senegalensis]|uniref:Myelin-associated glycoprotein-like isoform X2 n=1 Tax=Solea senegalensis TaxID=28829 RepID=A0AAV6PW12_SOLSE|nr:myelin-associated glycoprotein-like isoform X2 [Solea senegalensis]
MSFLDQMKFLGLTDLSFILFLISHSEGQTWNITVTPRINAIQGSNVIIPCTFTYPAKYYTKDVQVYWKKPGKRESNNKDRDINPFVFHTNDTFVLSKYRGKTKLIGNKNNGDCSLMIKNIVENERGLYMRVILKGQTYSFYKYPVSIYVHDNISQEITIPPLYTPTAKKETTLEPLKLYVAIFVPLSALVIIILVTTIFCYMKQKRTKSFTRESSGYYANFSRTTSNQPQGEASCTTNENKNPADLKVIDEPVYANTQDFRIHMDQSMDHLDNIYANYSG